jgi:acyl CoA:acetate/3-ketoacid CoA transferase beta subunit
MEISPDDFIVACISRQVKNGEIVAQGLATPLVAAGYLLARLTHAPDLYFASAIGQGICHEPAPLALTQVEKLWLDRSLTNVGFVRAAADMLPVLRPKEFFRPAQIDAQGNFNNIAFGKDYSHPRLRLPGTGGIPDVTTFINDIHLYIPRHSRLTFVPRVDFVSGMGFSPERTRGSGPRYLVTDLGQFDFLHGKMRLTHYHPGVSIQKIQSHTGFELEISPDVSETIPPSEEEFALLSQQIDPLGIRHLEGMSGAQRRQLLQDIIAAESAI